MLVRCLTCGLVAATLVFVAICARPQTAWALGEDEAQDLATEAQKEELVEELDEARARVRHVAARERVGQLEKTVRTLAQAAEPAELSANAAAQRYERAKLALEGAATNEVDAFKKEAEDAAKGNAASQTLKELLRAELVRTTDDLDEAKRREKRAASALRVAESKAKAARKLAANATAARSEERDACDATSADSAFCLFGGGFLASASATSMKVKGLHGQSAHRIVSLLIPFGGLRWAPGHTVAIDFGFLTGLLSKELTTNNKNTACRVESTRFEQLLPCEGNAVLRPYGALFIGPSLGNKDVIWLSGYLTLGFARTSQDPTANFFWGLMLGTAGIQKVLSL